VSVVDGALAEALAWMPDARAVLAHDRDGARLKHEMRRERGKPRRQRPRPADENPHDGRTEIVVRDARRHATEVRQGAAASMCVMFSRLSLVPARWMTPRSGSGRCHVDGALRRRSLTDRAHMAGRVMSSPSTVRRRRTSPA
jgi:hypothetical protein